MSTTIDQRVVEMRFDNKQFETNVQTSMSTIDKLKQSLNLTGAAKGLENIDAAAKKCDMSGLSGAVQTVQAKFSALEVMAVTALANITNSAINAGKKIVSALTIDPIKTGFTEYETQINAIQTILANTSSKGTTLNQVTAALAELNTYADKTIYNFTEMTRNIGTFTAAGVELDTSVQAIKGIANLAAVSGSNAQQASTAMYQLSQALSSGTVKLMDWNSVVNAGMGGQVFQDSLKETARLHGVTIDQMIKDEGSFRETLQNGWLSSEILTETLAKFTGDLSEAQLKQKGYTQEQIVEIMKLGEMANDAATKVKTFTQLFDTLKEAAQSGWTKSWEIIVGDFEEAKDLLTNISNVIGGIIGASADARNELLNKGLSSGWKQLLNEGIADEQGYIEAIKDIAREHGDAFDKMLDSTGSFTGSLKQGLKDGTITSDMLSDAVTKLADKMRNMSEEERKASGYTQEHLVQIEALESGLKNGTISMDEYAKKINELSGRENLVQTLSNAFDGLLSVIKPIKEAFQEIFPPYTGEQLYALTQKIRDLTASFKLSDETSANLKSTFKGLFAILDIVKQAFSAIFKAVMPFAGSFWSDFGGGILGVTAKWGDWLVKLNETIKTTGVFTTIMDGIVKALNVLKAAFEGFIKIIKEKIVFPGFEIFHSFLERVHERMTGVGEAAGKMGIGVSEAVNTMGTALENSDFLNMLTSLWNGVKTVGLGMVEILGEMGSGIAKVIGDINFDSVFDVISGLSLGGIAIAITKFLKSVREPLESFTDILDGVRGCFEAYQTQLKAGALLKIASAIAILTASILVISLIDSDKLAASLGAITVLFADLMVSMSLFGKISGNLTGVFKTCTAMISISIAVLILASALKKIGDLDFKQLVTGLVGVAGLTATMVAAAKILGNGSATMIKGATQMVIFAAAIKVLASACEDLSSLTWEELAKGLVGVGVLMGEISLFLNTAKFSGKSITTATGIVILAAAMKILASACADFGQMKWEDIGKGLTAIGVLLAEITVFTNLTGNAKHVISTGIALIAIGAAMKIFASSVKDFSTMPWEELARGLAGMAGALLAVTVAVNFMPKNMVGIGVGLIAVSTSLIIMANVLGKLGGMSWEEIAKGMVALGGSMTILAVGLNIMNGTLAGSAALIVAVAALAILAPVLSILGSMSWKSIAKGLVSLAGAFAVIGVAGLVLTPLVPAILGLAGSFALIGVAVLAIGAGLMAAGAGLSAVAIGFTALATAGAAGATAIVASLTVIIVGVASLIPAVIEKIGEGIIALCGVIAEGAPAIGKAVKAVILSLVDVLVECVPAIARGALELVAGVLVALVEYTPQIVDSIFQFLIGVLEGIARNLPGLIKAAIDVLMSFFSGIVDALSGIDVEVLLKGIAGIGLLSAIMIALAAVAALVPAAMIGVLGMGVVIAELALVLAAIGALAQIPGLKWLINEGAELMQGIGNAIGSFIGGIVGGFMSGVSSSFPKIADDLSAFMNNIQPFVEGARQIDASVMDGVKALAETILILTAANILEGLTSWFTGGSSMTKFGQELAEFGPYFKQYYESIKGVDGSVVESSANAALALAEFAKEIPNSGGVVGWFAGENSLSAFAEELMEFGPKLKAYADSVKGLDSSVVINSANAAKALAEMASNLPNSGGVVGWFTGENNLSAFAEELMEFGPKLKAYADSVRGVDGSVVENSANAAKALAEMSNNLPNQGGAVSWFTGDNTLSMFGEELMAFGPSLKAYADSVRGLDGNVVTNSANAAKALAELSTNLPNTGGIVSWFTGDNDIASFGEQLVSFGQSFASYYASVSTVNTAQLSGVVTEFKNLVDLANGMKSVDTSGMSTFSQNLTALGNAGIDGFINAFTNATSRVSTAATTMLTTFINSANAKKAELTTTFNNIIQAVINAINGKQAQFTTAGNAIMVKFIAGVRSQDTNSRTTFINIISGCLTAIKNKYYEFQSVGQECMVKFIAGVKSKDSSVKEAFVSNLSNAVRGIRDYYSEFYLAGKYLVEGFADGITKYTYLAEARARAMARAAAEAAAEELDEHSPSKVGYGIGAFFGLAFVNAIGDYESKSYKAGTGIAESAKEGLSNAVSKITDFINGDIEAQPTIRPVLDLTSVERGASKLSALFSRSQALSISAGMNRTADSEIQNGENTNTNGSTFTFTQNNYSPKALSRVDIYRQTKNQFSAMERMVQA